MGQPQGEGLKVSFDSSLRLEFHGSKVTSDAGLIPYRELESVLGLFDLTSTVFTDKRTGRNVHSAERWKEVLEPFVQRYEHKKIRQYFRGDAAFAKPELYEYLEENGFLYAIRLPSKVRHVSNGRGGSEQEAICRNPSQDQAIAMLHCIKSCFAGCPVGE